MPKSPKKRSPSPSSKRRALLLKQARSLANARLASMTRFNHLMRQIQLAHFRNKIKIPGKSK
jgi:hypothetical protein